MSIFSKKYLKDWLWFGTALTCVFGPVIFPGLSDYANHSFWWTLWDILGILTFVCTLGGWIYFWSTKKTKKNGS